MDSGFVFALEVSSGFLMAVTSFKYLQKNPAFGREDLGIFPKNLLVRNIPANGSRLRLRSLWSALRKWAGEGQKRCSANDMQEKTVANRI